MVSRVELSSGESFNKINDIREYVDNISNPINVLLNIMIGKDSEGILPDVIEIHDKFLSSLNLIKIYMKDNELSEEYI